MQFEWYDLTWGGFVNPLIFLAGSAVIGLLWDLRILSNKAYVGTVWVWQLVTLAQWDYVMFIAGIAGFQPETPWAPWPVRLLVYGAAIAFLVWGAWGWIRLIAGRDRVDRSRGLQYLRERRRCDQA